MAILAVNHSSFLDPVVVSVAVPRKIKWLIQKSVYQVWWLNWFMVLTKMIPENGAVGRALVELKNGRLIGIFPEGARSSDGKLHAVRKGIAILALQSGAPVIPCAIRGAFEAFPRSAALPKPHPIKITLGKPITFHAVEAPDEASINSALDRIISALKSLMEKSA